VKRFLCLGSIALALGLLSFCTQEAEAGPKGGKGPPLRLRQNHLRHEFFTQRFLNVRNEREDRVKVFVQFINTNGLNVTPVNPGLFEQPMSFDLDPGQNTFVQHLGQRIATNRVRIWGVTADGKTIGNPNQDIFVVPLVVTGGVPGYLAPEMNTYTYVFPRATAPVAPTQNPEEVKSEEKPSN
jgi:hypothetical protein